MEHITVGRTHSKGKIAFVHCVENGPLDAINIKGTCFLLIILTEGELAFIVGGKKFTATAPSFLCFDETEDPKFTSKAKAQYRCVYFHPRFLNVNMTFERLRSENYEDIATNHDMFMLKPFIDKMYVIPIADTQVEKVEHAAECMTSELEEQWDWYWSCRGRSYFMEIIIALERMYGLVRYGLTHQRSHNTPIVQNPKLRDAVLYIEGHYSESISLSNIAASAGITHTTLTALMKQELGCTAMEYVMHYRVAVSKKQLAFTELPIKGIANMVGFKTVPHFNRIFKEITGVTPAAFRKAAVQKRKDEIQ